MNLAIVHAAELVCVARNQERSLTGNALRDIALVRDGAVVIQDDVIRWVGSTGAMPSPSPGCAILDATSKTVLPGFVDSHTHLLFAGSREDEFELRLRGMSYQEISAQGGGINATVRRVRASTRQQLADLARPRLRRFLQFGVTTIEAKSG